MVKSLKKVWKRDERKGNKMFKGLFSLQTVLLSLNRGKNPPKERSEREGLAEEREKDSQK